MWQRAFLGAFGREQIIRDQLYLLRLGTYNCEITQMQIVACCIESNDKQSKRKKKQI